MFKLYATSEEKKQAAAFMQGSSPVSFSYGGRAFPDGFQYENGRYVACDRKLVCEFPFTFREDEAAVEWLPRFTNAGGENTQQIRDICALDYVFPADGAATVYYTEGCHAKIHDFALHSRVVEEEAFTLTSGGSRDHIPFFNLCTGSGGVMLGLGFSCQWSASFTMEKGGVHVVIRMPKTDFYLYPGESLRNILVLAMFWQGDLQRSFNRLRNYLVNYYIPQDENNEPNPPICCTSWGGMKTKNHLKYIDFLRESGLKFDCYWMDAGWYGPAHETDEYQNFYLEDWAYNHGEWTPNRCHHPDGLTPISQAAKAAGMDLLLWFGTYVANHGVGWHKEHPEWAGDDNTQFSGIGANKERLTIFHWINLGIPEARKWLADTVANTLKENNVKWYREDCSPPLLQEEADRIGTADMKSVEYMYAFWDHLRSHVPGLQIDNCGGGGSRIDLETLKRSYVLWRSDYNCNPASDPIGSQVANHGLGHFVPLVNGAPPLRPGSTYTFLSGLYGGMGFPLFHPCGYGEPEKHTWFAPDYPVEWHKQMLDIYRLAKPYLCGSFYPLTACSLERDEVMAYQFERPDLQGGLVMCFFRPECAADEMTIRPVLEKGRYCVRDVVCGDAFEMQVDDEVELTVRAKEKPQGILLHYQKM